MAKEIIKRILITEKGSAMSVQNRYCLEVDKTASKPQIRQAVEKKYGVHVLAVNTQNMKGGLRTIRGTRRQVKESTWKRAIVTVKAGDHRSWHSRHSRLVRRVCASAWPRRSRRSPRRSR